MKLSNMIKIISITLLISLILRFSYALGHINHECSHDNCPICTLIYELKKDFNSIGSSLIEIVIIIMSLFFSIKLYLNNKDDKKKKTLIELKVELLS